MLAKTQPMYEGSLKISPLRAPNGPQSYFASEQIVDELAHAANMDPIAFRRQNIDGTTVAGARWLSVLDAVTQAVGWKPKVAASNLKSGNVVTGRGFGFGTFASSQVGVVADIEVDKKTGKIVVKHAAVAQNNGITVMPDGVANQMSGALIQGLSRALLRGADLEQGADHEPGLGHLPDPALQGRPEGHARQRPPGQVHDRRPGRQRPST